MDSSRRGRAICIACSGAGGPPAALRGAPRRHLAAGLRYMHHLQQARGCRLLCLRRAAPPPGHRAELYASPAAGPEGRRLHCLRRAAPPPGRGAASPAAGPVGHRLRCLGRAALPPSLGAALSSSHAAGHAGRRLHCLGRAAATWPHDRTIRIASGGPVHSPLRCVRRAALPPGRWPSFRIACSRARGPPASLLEARRATTWPRGCIACSGARGPLAALLDARRAATRPRVRIVRIACRGPVHNPLRCLERAELPPGRRAAFFALPAARPMGRRLRCLRRATKRLLGLSYAHRMQRGMCAAGCSTWVAPSATCLWGRAVRLACRGARGPPAVLGRATPPRAR